MCKFCSHFRNVNDSVVHNKRRAHTSSTPDYHIGYNNNIDTRLTQINDINYHFKDNLNSYYIPFKKIYTFKYFLNVKHKWNHQHCVISIRYISQLHGPEQWNFRIIKQVICSTFLANNHFYSFLGGTFGIPIHHPPPSRVDIKCHHSIIRDYFPRQKHNWTVKSIVIELVKSFRISSDLLIIAISTKPSNDDALFVPVLIATPNHSFSQQQGQ